MCLCSMRLHINLLLLIVAFHSCGKYIVDIFFPELFWLLTDGIWVILHPTDTCISNTLQAAKWQSLLPFALCSIPFFQFLLFNLLGRWFQCFHFCPLVCSSTHWCYTTNLKLKHQVWFKYYNLIHITFESRRKKAERNGTVHLITCPSCLHWGNDWLGLGIGGDSGWPLIIASLWCVRNISGARS